MKWRSIRLGGYIVLIHWDNSLWIGTSHHSDTLSWFRVFPIAQFCVLSGEISNTNLIVYCLTRHGLHPQWNLHYIFYVWCNINIFNLYFTFLHMFVYLRFTWNTYCRRKCSCAMYVYMLYNIKGKQWYCVTLEVPETTPPFLF